MVAVIKKNVPVLRPSLEGLFFCFIVDTDLNQIMSLTFVSVPSVTNSGTYYTTGSSVGPNIATSTYYTVTGNKQTTASSSAYTYRIALKNKSTTAWSNGSTNDITGTYYVKYYTDTVSLNVKNGVATGTRGSSTATITVQYTDENGNTVSSTSTGTIYPKRGSTVSYYVDVFTDKQVVLSQRDEWDCLNPSELNYSPSGGRARIREGTFASSVGQVYIKTYYKWDTGPYDAYGYQTYTQVVYEFYIGTTSRGY